ncbi:MAG TPA: hypothetical protein VFO85_08300, partial [Vicinamibacteria bacterium]|nr:hypothetical protein [Vicinamibacteria bacterium]
MRILQQEFAHPRQVSRLRLNLYRYAPPAEARVAGLLPVQEGYHLTEERVSSTPVVASLGFFAEEAAARERFARRAEELARQGWGPATEPLLAPSIPPGSLDGAEPDGASASLATRSDPPRVTVPGDGTPRPVK